MSNKCQLSSRARVEGNPKSRSSGFTLVELIIYIGIVAIILVSITYLVFDIISGQTKSYVHLEVDQNLRFIKDIMTQDIKTASDFNIPSADVLNLDTGAVIYTFDGVNNKITRQEGAVINDITTDEIEVTGNFTSLSYNQRTKNVRVHLDINYKNPSNLSDYQASQVVDFTMELRGRR